MRFLTNILAKASLTVDGVTQLNTIANATTDTDKFLVSDGGIVKYRTGAEVLSDIGAAMASGYIPYIGATTNVNLGEFGLKSGYIGFDLTPTNTPTTQGTMSWNADKESLDLIMNGVTGSIMQDSFFNVKNQTGSSIPKGTIVRANGTVGASGRILIAPFLADGTYDSKFCIGVTAEIIADGDDGKVTAFGAIRQIDTSAFANGTVLYASPTTAGGFTSTEPSNPNNIVTVGIVVYSDSTNGEIFVRPTFIPSQADLVKSLGFTPVTNARTLTINGTTYDLSANRTWSVGTVTSIGTSGPLTGGTITGSGTIGITQATTSTDGYLSSTDWNTFNNKQAALGFTPVTNARTLTINGTTYDLSADRSWSVGTHTGSLTSGYIPKATGTTSLTDGLLYDTGSAVLLGTQTAGSGKFMVYSTTPDNHYQAIGSAPSFRFADTITSPTYTGIIGLATASNHFIIGAVAGDMVLSNNTNSAGNFLFGTGATERMRINASTGNISINNTNNTYKLDVTGTGRFTGILTLDSQLSFTGSAINYIQATNASGNLTFGVAANNSAFVVRSTGAVQIPTFTSGVVVSDAFGILSISTAYATQSYVTSQGYITSAALAPYTPNSRTLTINGTTYDLSANRSWTVGDVSGSGTTNYLPKFTGTSTIGNSDLITDSSGNLAIAQGNNPTQALNLYRAGSTQTVMAVGNSNTGLNGTYFGVDANGNGIMNTTGAFANIFSTNGSERMRINASGNLSIGNTNDSYRLDVTGEGRFSSTITAIAPSSAVALQVNGRSSDNIGQILFYANNGTTLYNYIQSRPSFFAINTETNTPIYFGTNMSAGDNTRMTITGSGLVGIGTTSPGATYSELLQLSKADVGRINVTHTNTTGTRQSDILFTEGTSLQFQVGTILGSGTFSDQVWLRGVSNIPMVFYTNDTERMRIASGGIVLIGGTNAYYGNLVLKSNSATTYYGLNVVANGNTNFVALNHTGTVGVIETEHSGGSFTDMTFRTGGSERMRITSGGLVGIGTTTPNSTLQVRGDNGSSASAVLRIRDTNATSRTTRLQFEDYNGTLADGLIDFKIGTAGVASSATLSIGVNSAGLTFSNTNAATFSSSVQASSVTATTSINGASVNTLGTQSTFRITSNYAGSGDIPAGTLMYLDDNTYTNLGLIPSSSGTAGSKIAAVAYNGSAWRSMWEFANVSSGNPNLILVKSGGSVGIGTTSPSEKLELSGTGNVYARITATDASNAGVRFNASGAREYGIFSDGALRFYDFTAATERMRITSGGNVGIGTTSPACKLHIEAPSASYGQFRITSTSDNTGEASINFGRTNQGLDGRWTVGQGVASIGDSFGFYTGGAPRMVLTTAGNVGIGTTSPTSISTYTTLEIRGATGGGIKIGKTSFSQFNIQHDGTDAYFNNTANGSLYMYTNDTERMRITSGGNVGIGTSSPGDKLTVSATYDANIRLTDTGVTNADWSLIPSSGNSVPIFRLYNRATATVNMTWTSDGKVGIGTTSPGSYALATEYGGSAAAVISIKNSSASGYSGAHFLNNSGSLMGHFGYANASTGAPLTDKVYFGSIASKDVVFTTNDTEKMRITSGGDVLVNATSTTQGAKFYVNGIGAFGSVYVGALGTGTVYSNAGFLTNTNPSDRRLKTNIIPLTYGLSDILKLNPVSYNWKDGTNGKQFGFIAQEVQEIMPDAVKQGEYLGLEKDAIYSALVNSVKELNKEIEILKSQLNK